MRGDHEQIRSAFGQRIRDLVNRVAAPHLERGDRAAGRHALDHIPEPRLHVLPFDLQLRLDHERREDGGGTALGGKGPGSRNHRDQVQAGPAGVGEDARKDECGDAVAARVESDNDVPAGECWRIPTGGGTQQKDRC